jgi:hypothetical protein
MNLLKEAKAKYKKGDLILSATGRVKAPIKVNEIKLSEISVDTVVNDNGGIICMPDEDTGEIVWAEKL